MTKPKIPISVVVATLNEEAVIERCLSSVQDFSEVIVVDSNSTDQTADIAARCSASVISFTWDQKYPKKRQWCLDTIPFSFDYIFFLDADEVVSPALCQELKTRTLTHAGYFVDGLYMVDGRPLKFGFRNRKLCLLDHRRMVFPVVDDLDIEGMGEIEGHYQPILKYPQNDHAVFPKLKNAVYHYALEDALRWQARHKGYAKWERGVIAKKTYPEDPVPLRAFVKSFVLNRRIKGLMLFFYYFFLKGGFLEGRRNLEFSLKKLRYYFSM